MFSRLLWFTQSEWERIYNFFIATREVYDFCHSNSEEYKLFIDNISKERRARIMDEHKNNKGYTVDYIVLKRVVASKEFKLLFSRLDDILTINGVKWE